MASTILNVLDFGARPDLRADASLAELKANRQSIQDAICSIRICGNVRDPNFRVLGTDPTKPVGATVRFPAGVYHIYGRLIIPDRQCFSLVGDGGVGGTTIVQHQDDEPIIEFTKEDTWGWTIENLWFTWQRPQTCDDDHSIAINFNTGQSTKNGFYNGVIDRCCFEGAYRGVSITPLEYKFSVEPHLIEGLIRALGDKPYAVTKELPELSAKFQRGTEALTLKATVTCDRLERRWRVVDSDNDRSYFVWREKDALNVYLGVSLPVWGTHIDHCRFDGCTGSAIYLVCYDCGMPGNSISNTYIRNYTTKAGGNRENEEPQLWLAGQNGMSLTSLDMEGSSKTVIYATSSIVSINGLYLERLTPKPKTKISILCFADLVYDIHALSLGGGNYEADEVYLIEGYGGASIVVSGLQAQFPSESKPIYLFHARPHTAGRKNSFRLIGRCLSHPSDRLKLCLSVPEMADLVSVMG